MAYKNLLVYVDDHESNSGCVQAAIDLARAHDAHLTGLYVSVEPVLPAAMRAEVAPYEPDLISIYELSTIINSLLVLISYFSIEIRQYPQLVGNTDAAV